MGGLPSVPANVDVATFRYPTATALRVCVIQSIDGLDDRWFMTDVPGSRCAYLQGRRVTGQVAYDDASVAWECSLVSGEFRAPSRVERDVYREQLGEGISHGGVAGAPRPRATDDQRRRPRSRPRPSRDRRACDPVCCGAVRGPRKLAGCAMIGRSSVIAAAGTPDRGRPLAALVLDLEPPRGC